MSGFPYCKITNEYVVNNSCSMTYEDAFNVRMLSSASSLLLSIEASRPAFMVVMGLFLLLVAWRLVHGSTGWASRFILVRCAAARLRLRGAGAAL